MSMSFDNNLDALFKKMENFVTTKTVVGDPINFGDVTIVPLIEVSFGVGAGSTNKDNEKAKGEGGGGGIGAKITPSAVIAIMNGTVQLINVKNQDSVNKLIDMVPGILSKLNFTFFKKKDADEKVKPTDSTFAESVMTEEADK